MDLEPDESVARRDFVKCAVAIGGSSALSACLDRERSRMQSASATAESATAGSTTADGLSVPRPADPTARPDALHRWNGALVRDANGNTVLPRHQVVLGLSYAGSVPPTEDDRRQVRSALATLDRAFRWGVGDDAGRSLNPGLLWMVGYTARYFERVDAPVPDALLAPEALLEAVGEDPAKADPFDAVLVLNADFGSVLLAAEAALWGERPSLNGVSVDATLAGVFERAARRTGVTGKGVVADRLDSDAVPEEAPLSMGYRSGFGDNQAPEDRVTIDGGAFAGGTTLALSRLHIDLDSWYDQSTEERVGEMFCPAHDADVVGDTADRLGNSSRITPEDAENVSAHAEEYGRIGHSQKLATARDDDFVPRILRRSEGVATDVVEGAGFNFTSVQADVDEFVTVRRAMDPAEHDADVAAEDNGIVDYLETRARTAAVVPPRDALAPPVP